MVEGPTRSTGTGESSGQTSPRELLQEGRVVSGRGRATSYLRATHAELVEKTGTPLVDGSLNVLLTRPIMLAPAAAVHFDGGKRMLWPARLGEHPVWISRWRDAPLHVAEVLAAVHLRTTLNLRDGDTIRLAIRADHFVPLSRSILLIWKAVWTARGHWFYTSDNYMRYSTKVAKKLGATQPSRKKGGTPMIRSLVKRTPILGALAKRAARRFRPPKKQAKSKVRQPYHFQRLELDGQPPPERQRRQLMNVLNYTKTSGASYAAQQYAAGYHTIVIDGICFQGQRNPAERLSKVPIDFRGKKVLDIGCNQGGMLFQLADSLQWGVGIDYDSRMVNAANRIRLARDLKNVHFFVFDLDKDPLELLHDLLPEERADVVFLLAVCAWIENWKNVIDLASTISDVVVFETTGRDEQQLEHEQYLRATFRDVRCLASASDDDPGQKKRRLLYCEGVIAANATAI